MTKNLTEQIRILIADDHIIVRAGVRLLLEAETDITVLGEASDGREALDMVERFHPDVVLMDIAMPIIDGLEATRRIKKNWPGVSVLVLTMHRSDEYFFEVLKAGASGFILKAGETIDLINAVRIVSRGGVYLHPAMAQKLVSDYLSLIEGDEGFRELLSPRETEIIKLIAKGYTSSEIAEKLVLSQSTIHSHRSNLMKKLGLDSRHELIKYALERGLLH